MPLTRGAAARAGNMNRVVAKGRRVKGIRGALTANRHTKILDSEGLTQAES